MSYTYIENSELAFESATLSGVTYYSPDNGIVLGGGDYYFINGIKAGILDTDIVYYINRYGGSSNTGELEPSGTYFVDNEKNTIYIGNINHGLLLQDGSSAVGYVMYTVESTQSRFGLGGTLAEHLVGVIYSGGQWKYDNNNSFVNFSSRDSDILIANLKWGISYCTHLRVAPPYYGIRTKQIEIPTSSGTVFNTATVGYSAISGLYFDGSNDYVALGDVTFNNELHTVEYYGTFDNSKCFFARGAVGESVGTNILRYSISDYNLNIWLETGSGSNHIYDLAHSVSLVGDNQFHHVAIVCYFSKISLYIDGNYEGSVTITNTDSTAPIYIGWDGNASYFKGICSYFRLWEIGRSANEIENNMYVDLVGNEDDLSVYYKFNLASGTTVPDISINDKDGTIVGASWVSTTVEARFSTNSGTTWSDFRTVSCFGTEIEEVCKLETPVLFDIKQTLRSENNNISPVLNSFYLNIDDLYKFSGDVRDVYGLVEGATIHLVNERTNEFKDSYITTVSGTFSLYSEDNEAHYLLCFPPSGTDYNALIYSNIITS